MIGGLDYSRPKAAGERLRSFAEDCHRFLHKTVLLTGEREILATDNGRECLLVSLRLVTRICANVSITLPSEAGLLLEECETLVDQLGCGSVVSFVPSPIKLESYDAILNIGGSVKPDLPWTTINSNGWLARVSSGTKPLGRDCSQSNPIGAMVAACLGVTEVFKRLIRLKESRGRLANGLTFSVFSFSEHDPSAGPQIPAELSLDLLLVGAGAIGNGVIYLLSRLPTSGKAAIIDGQTFGPENFGTCIMMGSSEIGVSKARFAAQALNHPGFTATGFEGEFSQVYSQMNGQASPSVVLTALDNIDARHEVQSELWPDLIIDGAIGDFACQVSRHPWGQDVACLKCLFVEPSSEPAEAIASRATGLTLDRSKQPSSSINEDDIQLAPAEKREWLTRRLGRQVCSVIEEGVAQVISEEKQTAAFHPSVPFVACLSAAMMVGELVKFLARTPSPLEPRYQLDVLRGPVNGLFLPQERRRDCICHTRRHNIELVRSLRNSTHGSQKPF